MNLEKNKNVPFGLVFSIGTHLGIYAISVKKQENAPSEISKPILYRTERTLMTSLRMEQQAKFAIRFQERTTTTQSKRW